MGKENSSLRSNIEQQLEEVNAKLRTLYSLNDEVKNIARAAIQQLNRNEKLNEIAKRILEKYSSDGMFSFDTECSQLSLNAMSETFVLEDLINHPGSDKLHQKLEAFDFDPLKCQQIAIPVAANIANEILQLLNSYTGYTFFLIGLSLNRYELKNGRPCFVVLFFFDFR